MLTATFQHVPGIGLLGERRLWDAGILSWEDALLASPGDLPVTQTVRNALIPILEASIEALDRGDGAYFAAVLPQREHWRAAPEFMERIGFLDIETNGGMSANDITIIGVYDGYESRIFVKERDLEDFEEEDRRCALWVTFFGTGFDLPFLRRRFPHLPLRQLHIDLCGSMKRLGYRGGLKKIEQQIGITRTPEVDGLSGSDAVRLWRHYRRHKDEDALARLIAYNRADIENLSLMLAFAYGRLKAASGYPG